MTKPTRTGLFRNPYYQTNDPDPFLGSGTDVECKFDNSDGVVDWKTSFDGGLYGAGQSEGRTYSQGAGTDKGNRGNASGKPQTMRVKGGGFGSR